MVGKMGGFGLFGVVFKGRLIMSKLTPQNPKLMGLLLEFIQKHIKDKKMSRGLSL